MSGGGFIPYACGVLWRSGLLQLNVAADALAGISCCLMPCALLSPLRRRRDLSFPPIFWLFAAFVLLCGASHLMDVWVLWRPSYDVESWVKAATAAASMAALFALGHHAPRALASASVAGPASPEAPPAEPRETPEAASGVPLDAVVNNFVDGIVTIDEAGLIASFNAACTRLFGYAPEEVIGKNVNVLMPNPHHDAHDGYLRNYRDSGVGKIIGSSGREVMGLHKDGSTFALDLSITSFKVDGVRFFAASLHDLSKQTAALEEREKLLSRLTHSNAELERFAYVASHDMQEPVRMMLSFSQLLEQDYAGVLDDDAQSYLKIIGSSALRMSDMIRDLMDYARLDSERQKFGPVDLGQELLAVRKNLRHVIKDSGAVITSDALPQVTGSAVQLMRLLQNLVINAIKYQPAEQTPRIHLGVVEEDGGTVFYLRDNGLGIQPAFIEEIFEPFRRLHTWNAIQGTGLGLSVCRKIVEAHHGRIWAASNPGEGTTIFFTLTPHLGDAAETAPTAVQAATGPRSALLEAP